MLNIVGSYTNLPLMLEYGHEKGEVCVLGPDALRLLPTSVMSVLLNSPPAPGATASSLIYSFNSIQECHGDVEDYTAHINLLCCLQER